MVRCIMFCIVMLIFAITDITEGQKGWSVDFYKAGLSAVKKNEEKNYVKLYDTHLNLAGYDFVMYRLIHINRSQYVFVI